MTLQTKDIELIEKTGNGINILELDINLEIQLALKSWLKEKVFCTIQNMIIAATAVIVLMDAEF